MWYAQGGRCSAVDVETEGIEDFRKANLSKVAIVFETLDRIDDRVRDVDQGGVALKLHLNDARAIITQKEVEEIGLDDAEAHPRESMLQAANKSLSNSEIAINLEVAIRIADDVESNTDCQRHDQKHSSILSINHESTSE